MKKAVIVAMTMVVAVVLSASVSVAADDAAARIAALETENTVLKQRLSTMESELADIKVMLKEEKPVSELAPTEKPAVRSKYDVDLYGYLKVDAIYNTDRVVDGNVNLFVLPQGTNEGDDQFNLTARQSRLGLLFKV